MSRTKAVFYDKVTEIPTLYWQQLGCTENVYYTPEFLHAYETANADIQFRYIVLVNDAQEAVAFANTQIVTIPIATITQNIKISDRLKRGIHKLFCNTTPRIMFCGNIFLSGEYGTFLRSGEDKDALFIALAKALKSVMKDTKKLHAVFVKDFKRASLPITDQLLNHKFTPMQVEPNMIIELQPSWNTFEDYKNALKSKYRVKANRADSKSNSLRMEVFSAKTIKQYTEQLQALYENTIANANFNAQVLDLNTYVLLKETYGEQFIVQGYFLENQLVGFLSAMKNGENLDAHFIGIDYNLNKELAVYPRILNDYVRLGIQHRVKSINLGRTASEIKSTLGAKPEDLMCYIRHKQPLLNALMKPFLKNIQIKSFKEHQPFKN